MAVRERIQKELKESAPDGDEARAEVKLVDEEKAQGKEET